MTNPKYPYYMRIGLTMEMKKDVEKLSEEMQVTQAEVGRRALARYITSEKEEIQPKYELDRLKKIMEGIDKTETESLKGWWSNSNGAKFGSNILVQIEDLFRGKYGGL